MVQVAVYVHIHACTTVYPAYVETLAHIRQEIAYFEPADLHTYIVCTFLHVIFQVHAYGPAVRKMQIQSHIGALAGEIDPGNIQRKVPETEFGAQQSVAVLDCAVIYGYVVKTQVPSCGAYRVLDGCGIGAEPFHNIAEIEFFAALNDIYTERIERYAFYYDLAAEKLRQGHAHAQLAERGELRRVVGFGNRKAAYAKRPAEYVYSQPVDIYLSARKFLAVLYDVAAGQRRDEYGCQKNYRNER